jgi:hypothetical protein
MTKRNLADANLRSDGKASSFRVNTSFGKDIRISPTISIWDQSGNDSHILNSETKAEAPFDGDSLLGGGGGGGDNYLLTNVVDDSSSMQVSVVTSLDKTLGGETLASKDLSQPFLKNSSSNKPKVALQSSIIFPPAPIGAIFEDGEKKKIFKGILPDCSLTEAEEVLMVTVAHLGQFKQQFSDRLSEVERRQDLEIDFLYAIKNQMKI